MSIVWDLDDSTSYGQLLLLLTLIGRHFHVVVWALKSSREEYKLQKITYCKTVSGLKIAFSDFSWML